LNQAAGSAVILHNGVITTLVL